MTDRLNPTPLRTSGHAWGRIRVGLGISMSELHRKSGVSPPILSFIEKGRIVPTAEEFEAVWVALGGALPANLSGVEPRGTVTRTIVVRAPRDPSSAGATAPVSSRGPGRDALPDRS